ncbi:hypothetical protein OAE62_00865 [bacterium]|nr:hypothetical protein [bacterium]
MYYVTETKAALEAYHQKIIDGEGYDGVIVQGWASIIEHQNGDKWAMLKHPSYPLIEGVDENGESLDAPTVEDISDFYPPIEP